MGADTAGSLRLTVGLGGNLVEEEGGIGIGGEGVSVDSDLEGDFPGFVGPERKGLVEFQVWSTERKVEERMGGGGVIDN